MKQCHSASQEIPHLLLYFKIYYRVHNIPPLVSILSGINPAHNFPINFSKIHFNIILSSSHKSSK
jgi:hypothetical protein